MPAANKNVVFDVVGTLVGYDKLFEAIDARLGDRLRAQGVKPVLLGYTWIEVAEREYTYLSMSGKYVSYAEVFEKIFWRMIWKAGIEQARDFASSEDLTYIMEHGYKQLTLRPGAKECIEKLRSAGFTVRAFTMGDLKRVGAYFSNAGVEMPSEHLQSCDTSEIGKPDPAAYKPLLERLSQEGGRPWFAAAHMWDVSAAKRTGFRGAYCSVWENEALTDLFGDMDVLSDSLPAMADKIIAATQ
ncbi:putative HAD hydrolase, subfamily IA, phosphoglycolate phosphatase-like, domain 2, HAD superfamily [Septoria linicola]|nr:putative HAD hydrolase, subfamily IA, phosphoglycolate phosphatase-like, domain 2, HAD superfamily [Septoria linicola]